ncbi:TniB family NTP-binding protein [Metapseudomonas furukawaii]|nr:TniB family NTP-binding protein [Pseudomonas furukawaii]WAG78902.1 TniB family NTP-binding protein [Pseudomonas furukawaii]
MVAKIMREPVSPETAQRIFDLRKDVWVGYEAALEVRYHLEQLLIHPDSNRMPCLALLGRSQNGKSSILANFLKRNPPVSDPNAEKALMPVLLIDMPPAPIEGRLYYRILSKFGVAGSARESDESMLHRICILLSHLETKMLIVDEAFNLNGGSHTQHQRMLNAIRGICTSLRIPVVIAGVPQVEPILARDESIGNRFRPVYLPSWNDKRLEEYARFIKTFLKHFKLANQSNLMDENALMQLLHFSDGLLGETVKILTVLAEMAIRSGEEVIEPKHITKQHLDAAGYVPPATGRS